MIFNGTLSLCTIDMDALTELTSTSIRIKVNLRSVFISTILSSIHVNQRQSLTTLVSFKSVPIRVNAYQSQCLSESMPIRVNAYQSQCLSESMPIRVNANQSLCQSFGCTKLSI